MMHKRRSYFSAGPNSRMSPLNFQAALAGLIILGFGMVALIWLAARVTQRYRHRTPYFQPTPRPGEHDWAKRPLDRDT